MKLLIKNIRKLLTSFLAILITLTSFLVAFPQNSKIEVYASDDDLYEQLKELEEELREIKEKKQQLNDKIAGEKNLQSSLTSQIYSITNSILQLELDIAEKEIETEKKETEIKILEEDITEAKQQIKSMEKDVETLENTANDIIKTIYIESKTNSMIDLLLTSGEGQSFMSQVQYHTALGAHDQNALEELQSEKDNLQAQKDKMENNKVEIEKITEQIKEQKEDLEKDRESLSAQKAQKSKLLQDSKVAAAYYGGQYTNLSDEEMKKEAEMDYILQQIAFGAGKPKGYVVKGQIIATEGMNGCATGPHTHFGLTINPGTYPPPASSWVDPCNYFPYRSFWWGICSGNGSIRYPYNDPLYSSRGFTWYHKGIDLIAGSNKYVYASHNGYYFEEVSSCSPSWCKYGCHGNQTCIRVCEDVNCVSGKISIYCHVNFLP